MSKLKKFLIAMYIVIIVTFSAVMLNKISAAPGDIVASGSINYGKYQVEELERETITTNVGSIPNGTPASWSYDEIIGLKQLMSFDWVFCIDESVKLPYKEEQNVIYKFTETGEPRDNQVAEHDFPDATGVKTGTIVAIDPTITYYSRKIDLSLASLRKVSDIRKAEAYVMAKATGKNGSTYHTDYQLAMWKLRDGGYKEYGGPIYDEAMAFENYIKNREAPKVRESNKYTFRYRKSSNTFIAGPITIDYGNLTESYGSATITVREVESFKLFGTTIDGATQEISNYSIIDANGNRFSKFPKTGEEFYIEISESAYEACQSISSFKVTFKMLNADATAYQLTNGKLKHAMWGSTTVAYDKAGGDWRHVEAGSYTTKDRVTHEGCKAITHGGSEVFGCYDESAICNKQHWIYVGHNINCPQGCTASHIVDKGHDSSCIKEIKHAYVYLREIKCYDFMPLDRYAAQDLFLVERAELYWDRFELTIEFDQGQHTYFDLAGRVWIDKLPDDKDPKLDGIYTGSPDYPRQNVKVELFFADGTPVREGRGNNVVINKGGKNPTDYTLWTDVNGEYKFYNLPFGNDYYVQFTYDGITYATVPYLAGGNDVDYRANPNSARYTNNSKVDGEIRRQEFNNKFETISGKTKISGERTYGRSNGVNNNENLEYWTRRFKTNLESRLLTTNNSADVLGEPATGKARRDYEMSARSKNTYPFYDRDINIWTPTKGNSELDYLKHVNLGLYIRAKVDLALQTQIKAGGMTIKDKEKVVFYGLKSDLIVDGSNQVDEYIHQEISASDYNWRALYQEIYGDNGQVTGYVVDDDQLNVYVLYRITVANQSEDGGAFAVVRELVDYFDSRMELVPAKDVSKVSALFHTNGFNVPIGTTSWIEGSNTPVSWRQENNLNGYKTIRTTDLTLNVGTGSSSASVYLILKVSNNRDDIDVLYTGTDNEADGMKNIAEISKYSMYVGGVPAGKIDKDSAPENAIPGEKYYTYEDDTDDAPMFRLEINWKPKLIEGTVWDDLNENGKIDENQPIKDVTVKLIEYIEKNGNIVAVERPGLYIGNRTIGTIDSWPIKTESNGKYSFYVEGGDYQLKFIYGDKEMLISNKKYNGQDYQSTKYTALSDNDTKLAYPTIQRLKDSKIKLVTDDLDWSELQALSKWENNNSNWNITTNDKLNSVRDNANIRADIIYNTSVINNSNGTILRELSGDANLSSNNATYLSGNNTADHLNPNDAYYPRNGGRRYIPSNTEDPYDYPSTYNTSQSSHNYTYVESISDIITVASNDLVKSKVINLGLKERPIADIDLEKKVTRLLLRTSDGRTLIDSSDETKLANLQKLDDIQSTFINMDAELMDGATMDIDYEIRIKNNSQNDTLQNYVSIAKDEEIMNNLAANLNSVSESISNSISGTRNNPRLTRLSNLPVRATIYDYVNINLEYRADDDTNEVTILNESTGEERKEYTVKWKKVYDDDDRTDDVTGKSAIPLAGGITDRLKRTERVVSKVLRKSTTNIQSGSTEVIPVHLGITLAENTSSTDLDFDFSNCAEIVHLYSAPGRRDYGTIPGNYLPYEKPIENDADRTGTTSITPPLGQERIYYVIIAISATIIIVGVVLIKKRVLRK